MTIPFNHNARSYYDVYNAFKTHYPNKPDWLFTEYSGGFEFLSELQNRIAWDIMNPTTRESAYFFASLCDYDPIEADGHTGTATITLTGAMAKTLTTDYQLSGLSSATNELLIYELTADASSGGTDTISASVKQKLSYTDVNIGTVESSSAFSEMPLTGYLKIIKSSISLTINSLAWTRVDNFDNSLSTDRHFILIYQSNGKATILFGNDTTGAIPPLGYSVLVSFEITTGLSGLLEIGELNINQGADTDISSVTNAAATSGGVDAEGVTSIVRNARANVRLKNMIWSVEDIQIAAVSVSGVLKAQGITGLGTMGCYIIPEGGGTPSSGLKTSVDTYVTSLTQFGLVPVTVSDPVYISTNIAATLTVRSGFTSATVLDLCEFALTLASSAIDDEIISYYSDNGIDACRTVKINTIWSWAFASDENEALEFIINKWQDLLGTRDYREWGQDLEVGDLWIIGNSLYDFGGDEFALTTPTANVTISSIQISDTGTMAVT